MSSAAKKGKGKGKKSGKKGAAAKKNTKSAKKDPKAGKNAAKGKKVAKKNPKSSKKDPKSGGKKGTGKKGAAAKKGGKKGSNAKSAAPAAAEEEEKKMDDPVKSKHYHSPSTVVNTGPAIILPKTAEFVTKMDAQTVTPLMNDDNVEQLKDQYENLERLMRQRKKDCLLRARILVLRDGEDTPPICIDIAGMKQLLEDVGRVRGARSYDVLCRTQEVLDKGNELLAYEAKHRAVTKTRERTTPEMIQAEIDECKEALGQAEPILQASKDALSSITKSALDEIRALPNPHRLLIRTVKACAIMVGQNEANLDTWGNVKKILKTSFITNLLEFEARDITQAQRDRLESSDYLGKDGLEESDHLTYENVNKANGVAGCLVKWLEAQLKYNEFIPKVEPELARLEGLKIDLQSIDGKIEKLDTALSILNKNIVESKQGLRDNGRAFNTAIKNLNDCRA